MGALFNANEQKERPGVYRRYVNYGDTLVAGADDGICAIALAANWGPIGSVMAFESVNRFKRVYGNVEDGIKLFEGGAKTVYVSRVGSGGTKGTLSIKDGAGTQAVSLTSLYEGTFSPAVTIRESLADDLVKEFIVYDETSILETITFAKGTAEPQALVDAINEKSEYFTASKVSDGDGKVESLAQKAITPGSNPDVTNESYSNAFETLEPYKFQTLCVDTDTQAVHLLVHAFIKRIYESGGLSVGVVGEPTSVTFSDRLKHASAYNDEKMIYVGGSYADFNGNTVEGHTAAALIAGYVASTPSNESIVHTVIPYANETKEKLTNSQYVSAIKNGMILFSETANGKVQIDSGVNTLVEPGQDQDIGWKKIKRTKVRFELFDRIDRMVSPVIGKINCNSDGVLNVIKLAQDVIDAMIADGKLLPGGEIIEDPDNPFKNDSAWFIINVDDVDTLEKIYLKYQFRFSAN